MKNLFTAVATYLQSAEPWPEVAQAMQAASETPSLVAGPSSAGPTRQSPPIRLDVEGLVGNDQTESVLAAFRPVALDMRWRQNPTYTDEAFLSSYAYSELVGPNGLIVHATVSIGLLYLAPETNYPPHSHPAEEVYHLLAGESEWWAEPETHKTQLVRQPGDRMEHPSWISHSMRTGSAPMLALYIWRGELDTPARLTQPTPSRR
jgi:Dimethlysulfonioproprionate lyase